MPDLNRLAALYHEGRFAAAADLGETLRLDSPPAAVLYYLGAAYLQLRRFEDAALCFERTLALEPRNASALIGTGLVLRAQERHEEALGYFERAVAEQPADAFAQINLGAAREERADFDAARLCFQRAIEIDPSFAEAHAYLGVILRKLGDRRASIAAVTRAIALRPDYAEAYNHLANTQHEAGLAEAAIENYRAALRIEPNLTEAHYGLGLALKDLGRREEAITALTRALELNPRHELARAQRLYQLAQICDWPALTADAAHLDSLGLDQPISPFSLLALDDDAGRQRRRAICYTRKHFSQTRSPAPRRASSSRIRVGYFSADFRNHAMMHVMARVFELHDRSRFEVHGFSLSARAPDAMTERVMTAFDHFHAAHELSDQDVAERARALHLDIAVDLMGFTNGARSSIFARGAAPVQVAHLGYPGTMGAPFMDYLIADRTLIPSDARKFYCEKIIYLPYTYQASDNTRPIAERPSRYDLDLPAHGFVFCCFNNTYKIGPAEFDVWMSLLRSIEGSVLWLVGTSAAAERNLRREAQNRGVDPSRIVFAARVPPPEHLARQQAADLFLDTFNYNAHGTANDALWAGLPIVTKLGRTFPSRVGASVLTAIGLADLIAADTAEYERIAHRLATDPARLATVRERLLAGRTSAPLFNSEAYTRHLEAAFQTLHSRELSQLPREDITISG